MKEGCWELSELGLGLGGWGVDGLPYSATRLCFCCRSTTNDFANAERKEENEKGVEGGKNMIEYWTMELYWPIAFDILTVLSRMWAVLGGRGRLQKSPTRYEI